MKNYTSLSIPLFLTLMLGCALNADVSNNDISDNDPPVGGSGGNTVLPPNGGTAGVGGNSNAGTGGSAGVGGDASEGGSENYPDAGVAGSAGEAGTGNVGNDAGTDPDPVVRVCNTPEAVGSDKGNWFTTNVFTRELRTHWFQLITADGFSSDGCTYVGNIKWYRPMTDQLGYVWYESGGMYDDPSTVFTVSFNEDGSVADKILPSANGGTVSPGANFSIGVCYFASLDPQERYSANGEYQLHGCLRNWVSGHALSGAGMFRGEWDDDFSKPILLEVLPEQAGL